MKGRVISLALVLLTAAACVCPSPPVELPPAELPRMAGPLPDRPSFQDLFELDSVASPIVDPTGSRIAYIRRTNAVDAGSRELRLWSEAGDTRLIGSDEGFAGGAQWTPDGRFLVFLSRTEEGTALHFLDPDSPGDVSRVHEIPLTGVQSVDLAPDGGSAVVRVGDAPPATRAREQALIGPFGEEDVPAPLSHLWLLDLSGADIAPRRLTEGNFSVYDVAWSPTRSELAIVVGPALERNNWWLRDISLVDVATGTLTPWVTQAGPDTSPIWSPDGERLAFSTTFDAALTNAAPDIAVVARPGSEDGSDNTLPALEVLTEDFPTAPIPFTWTEAGDIFGSAVGTGVGLYRINPDGTIERVGSSDLVVAGVSTAGPGTPALAILAATADGMTEVYRMRLPDGGVTKVTDVSAQVADWSLGTRETVRWNADDGVTIEGVLHTPDGFVPGEQRPLVVVVHGGPRAASRETIAGHLGRSAYPVVHWLWKGALVLEPNYRGSSAYGTEFRQLHRAGVGHGDAGDVLAGIRHLVSQGLVDPERVGVMGWSYGGFISAWLSATSTEVAAASVGAGITDWSTHYGWESANFTTRDFSFAGPPWQRADAYERASPLTYIGGANTPTLVQHVEDDPIVPMAGARRFYRALLEQDVPTRMIIYPGRSHGIPQPRQSLGAMWHNWQWFARYLWDEDVEIPIDRTDDPTR